VITAPAGAGKTTGVAAWVRDFGPLADVTWVKLGDRSIDSPGLLRVLRSDLASEDEPGLVILDDWPTHPSPGLVKEFSTLLSRAGQNLHVVLIASATPALPLHRLLGSGNLVKVGFDDLVMDQNEVKLVLAQHGVETSDATVQAVLEHTAGWAWGVHVAALCLQGSSSVEVALRQTDEEIFQFFDSEVLSQIPRQAREMIITTSVADPVPLDLAYGVAARGSDGLLSSLEGHNGFIDLNSDGSFRCHPLLRKAAFARLSRRSPSAIPNAYRQAAQWYADRGDPTIAIDLAIKGGNRAWAARALVRSLAVPQILTGAASDVVQQVVECAEFGESEPLLLASAALACSCLDIAESAIARATSELSEIPEPELPDVLSLALLDMATSTLRGDAIGGAAAVRHITELTTRLSLSERAKAPELSPLIDYHTAGFELLKGNVETARLTLRRGAGHLPSEPDGDSSPAEHRIRADCAGQLAWLDAFCGELRRATRYATSVLTDRQADSSEPGVNFAHLATAWVHLERGEVEQARQRLDHALSRITDCREPLLQAAQLLTQVKMALVAGEPDSALRLLPPGTVDSLMYGGWFFSQFLVASAEANLAAGEPQQAIATLTSLSDLGGAAGSVLLARALLETGSHAAAADVLMRVPPHSTSTPLVCGVQCWLLQAELAVERGDTERARLLTDRALLTAGKEELRMAVGIALPWLRSFADKFALLPRHSAFLTSLPQICGSADNHRRSASLAPDGTFIVPLTLRETEVLRLLAQFCSNDEIAANLVVSMNTVKTHMRSLFQKLSVTRRADAVRRGQALGLC
jgi:LuxR family transcriptional regulator, maltose regulon positive regulatory protein